ncbi:3-phosphoserine/phosphohydroxythreonine transaminase [Pontibacter sp. G13]|uniref:3-phosphoserine/phosphohydroxythreonine transaminase n=1 Tax=Pontibacter sp. G13 TaxID=3074898 RepID=UPI00288A4F57|nr:3-phosphoserine/phosphohydroxythreonine transaminase [Pontibacter sp. G13]WNJ19808.1 3-phosphoserine/phosphohydroxythreonine transaminase [Pontibacter sp. G13]
MTEPFNFSAGPAVLPKAVLAKAQAELANYQGTGMSIMEVSHRSALFQAVIDEAEASLRRLMEIPDNYHVLFLQGGASTQFSMIPMNLLEGGETVDVLDTGAWSQKAIKELDRVAKSHVVASSQSESYTTIPDIRTADWLETSAYRHITTNNTIFGTLMPEIPVHDSIPVVADMSSNILSQPYRVQDFGLIYAGAQKNIGPAGMTVVIIRDDLVGAGRPELPTMMTYRTHVDKKSMFNTPPTFAIYLSKLVFQWLEEQGGVSAIHAINQQKADLLYGYLDQSELFHATVAAPYRSLMNVCFKTNDSAIDHAFLGEAESANLHFLKGHRSVGGMRASLYNAMPIAGVERLLEVMDSFEQKQKRS